MEFAPGIQVAAIGGMSPVLVLVCGDLSHGGTTMEGAMASCRFTWALPPVEDGAKVYMFGFAFKCVDVFIA